MTRMQAARENYARMQAQVGAPRVAVRMPVRRIDWRLWWALFIGGAACAMALSVWL